MPKTTKKPIKVEKPYKVTLILGDLDYKAQGDTLLEAIEALEVNDIRTSGLLVVRKDELVAERRFPSIFKLKRFLNNKITKLIVAKNMEMMLK